MWKLDNDDNSNKTNEPKPVDYFGIFRSTTINSDHTKISFTTLISFLMTLYEDSFLRPSSLTYFPMVFPVSTTTSRYWDVNVSGTPQNGHTVFYHDFASSEFLSTTYILFERQSSIHAPLILWFRPKPAISIQIPVCRSQQKNLIILFALLYGPLKLKIHFQALGTKQ